MKKQAKKPITGRFIVDDDAEMGRSFFVPTRMIKVYAKMLDDAHIPYRFWSPRKHLYVSADTYERLYKDAKSKNIIINFFD